MEYVKRLEKLQNEYGEIRKNGLARKIEIVTSIGVYTIANEEVINKVIDFLIAEAQERIKRELEDCE